MHSDWLSVAMSKTATRILIDSLLAQYVLTCSRVIFPAHSLPSWYPVISPIFCPVNPEIRFFPRFCLNLKPIFKIPDSFCMNIYGLQFHNADVPNIQSCLPRNLHLQRAFSKLYLIWVINPLHNRHNIDSVLNRVTS